MTTTNDIQTVPVHLGERSYEIRIGDRLIEQLGEQTEDLLSKDAPVVVVTTDPLVLPYGRPAQQALQKAGYESSLCAVPDGEGAKTMDNVNLILDHLVHHRLPRQSTLFAVGGGVIGDMAGFAAAIYLRGIPFVQVPTTLLAMVDSSVGGKTGVNHALGKNLIGAFYQPRRVVMDLRALATLPRREYISGLAEVIKHGVIRDAELFATLEKNAESLLAKDASLLGPVIRRNCEIKAAVVEADERETGERAHLNFGHTIGHGVETLAARFGMLHGEAVSIGMVGAARLAVKMNLWQADQAQRLESLLEAVGLPVRIPAILPAEMILERMRHDKKVVGKTMRFVLPEAYGRVTIRSDVPEDMLRETIEEMR